MKKLFTLLMALSLIAGLNAAQLATRGQKQVVKAEKVEKVQKIEFDATMFQAEIDLIKRLDVKRAEDEGGDEGGDEGNPGSSDEGGGGAQGGDDPIDTSIPLNITAFKASYLGTIAYKLQGYSMPIWNLEFTNDDADTLTISILYPRYNVLAYNDTLQAGGKLQLHGAEALELSNPESHLLIAYLSEDQSGYTYHVEMELLAEDGHVYTFNGDLQVDAWDAYFEMYCEDGQTEACDYMEVTLIDGPSDPIEDVFTTQLTQDQIKVTQYESIHAFAYSFETEDFEGMAFVYALTQAGEFAPKFFDLSYSYLYAGDEEVLLDSVAGSVVDNGDGTFDFDFTFYPHFGGTAYQFTGTCGEAALPVPEEYEYDADEDLDLTFEATYYLSTTHFSEDNYVYLAFSDADEEYAGAAFFNFAAMDPETTIPAGVYNIEFYNSQTGIGMNTCDASTGVAEEDDGYLYPQPIYIGAYDAEGYPSAFWFLVEGTVTVSKVGDKLQLEINAKNYKGYDVHIVCQGAIPTSGLEEVVANSNIRKFIDNGQIMVVRDGKVFNILGARVK